VGERRGCKGDREQGVSCRQELAVGMVRVGRGHGVGVRYDCGQPLCRGMSRATGTGLNGGLFLAV
jgi:hypothetical protein